MKTSNRILLAFLILILLFITVFIVSIKRDLYRPETHESLGKTEQQKTLPKFYKIEAENKIFINYTQDTFQKVVIRADSAILNSIRMEVRNGKLLVGTKRHTNWRQRIEIDITTDSIDEVNLSGGSSFSTDRKIKVRQFDGTASAGSKLDVEGEFSEVNLWLSAGSKGNFSGHCRNLIVNSSAGSSVNSDSLLAEKGNISANAGSMVNVSVSKELSVHANSGSVVKCKGDPQIKTIDVSSGAQFIK